jgi:hypothetical protein
MPILRDFERRLGSLVEGTFARAFRGGVQPVELAKRVLREMDAGKTIGVSELWAPNHFEFFLSPADAEHLSRAEQLLASELALVVRQEAYERGWGLVGPPEFVFTIDDQLGKGRLRCLALLVEGEDQIAPAGPGSGPAPSAPAVPGNQPPVDRGSTQISLVVMEPGTPARTVRIDRPTVTIGRLSECDIVLADPGASRRHVQLHTSDGETVLTDLGSTNGTLVNDAETQRAELHDGDRITLGSTVLEFRSGG